MPGKRTAAKAAALSRVIVRKHAVPHSISLPAVITMVLNIFNTREVEEFATVLANDLGRRFPPASEARTDPGAKHQIKVILDGLAARAVRYHEQNKLGIYRKAKLGNVFKWKLKELGYSDEFAEQATKEIVTHLAVR
jgi:hypothetical protein